jgi:hypothetical protein
MSETETTQRQYPAPDLLKGFIGGHPGLTQAAAAKQIGITPSALTQYLGRKQRPRADIQRRIAKWSGGAVPESAWLLPGEANDLDDVPEAFVPPPKVQSEPPPAEEPAPDSASKPTGAPASGTGTDGGGE